MTIPTNNTTDNNKLITQRKQKLKILREVRNPYINGFTPKHSASELLQNYNHYESEDLAKQHNSVSIAGRLMLKRVMGKSSFAQIMDGSGKIQIYVSRDDLPEGEYNHIFKKLDIGDIVGVTGYVFKTKTGELSIRVKMCLLLTKSLRPLPEKFHGLSDIEIKYRKRYIDLIVNEESKKVFIRRSKIIHYIRNFFIDDGFIEVETPMMQTIPGGATARPFITHHNALDMDLYLRVAPELYLKRLVVGGMERVFEINRNFRNEGLSTRHNPEFTMIEFYRAYATYEDLMDMTEELLKKIAQDVCESTHITYGEYSLDFSQPFTRMSVVESILHYNQDISANELNSRENAMKVAENLEILIKEDWGLGKIQVEIFEHTVEQKLVQPTFITQYPKEVSPLARVNDENDFITDRFELFIGGREIANGFSELNDPVDQRQRFLAQIAQKEAGDEEAMFYDSDYIEALEYAMPPTAGEGIGIDRLVMLFTNSHSIRDVLLFPQMKKESEL